MCTMDTEIVTVSGGLPRQADTDEQAISLWLHGKATHSQRAYRLDVGRFRAFIASRFQQSGWKTFNGSRTRYLGWPLPHRSALLRR